MQNFYRALAALRDTNGQNTLIKKLSPSREFRNPLNRKWLIDWADSWKSPKGMFTRKVVSQYAKVFEDKDRLIKLLWQR